MSSSLLTWYGWPKYSAIIFESLQYSMSVSLRWRGVRSPLEEGADLLKSWAACVANIEGHYKIKDRIFDIFSQLYIFGNLFCRYKKWLHVISLRFGSAPHDTGLLSLCTYPANPGHIHQLLAFLVSQNAIGDSAFWLEAIAYNLIWLLYIA